MEHQQQHSIFYRIGKGVFNALLLIGLPGWLAFVFYEEFDRWYSGISDLPVFEKAHGGFKTGLQFAGVAILRESQKFYDPDTMRLSNDDFQLTENQEVRPTKNRIFWNDDEIEADLLSSFPPGKHANVRAYFTYLRQHKHLALSEMRRSKIPASVTLAQGLLESDAGRSYLARVANNHFGIKCRQQTRLRSGNSLRDGDFGHHSLAIDCIQRTDDNVWDRFEMYESHEASFRRHSLLLLGERYNWMLAAYPIGKICPLRRKFLGENEAPYFSGWALGLKDSGYATSKRYAEKISLIIETYQLWRIDYELVFSA